MADERSPRNRLPRGSRSSKWVRRNVGWAFAALLAATLVFGSMLGAAAHMWRLRIEALRATAAETRALDNGRRGYEAINRLIQDWSRDAPATPAWRTIDAQIKDDALVFLYDALDDADDADPRVRLTRGMLLTYAGSVQRTMERYELARRDLMLAADTLQPLCDDPRYGAEAHSHQSNCRYNLGLTLGSLNQPAEAEQQFDESLALLPSLTVNDGDFQLLSRAAAQYEGIGAARLARAQLDRALDSYRTILDLRRRMFALSPGDLSNRIRFADACRTYVAYAARQDGFDDSKRLLDEGEAALRFGFENQTPPGVAKGLARLASIRAVLEVDFGSVNQALACHDQGIELAQQALSQEPNDIEAKAWLHSLHRAKAYTLCRLDRFAEALPHWDRAIGFAEGEGRTFCRIERALERAVVGEHRQATDEAAKIFHAANPQNLTWLNAARVYSRALEAVERDSALDEAERLHAIRDYAQRGLECLARITSTGNGTFLLGTLLDEIDTDPSFAALRATDGFHEWRSSR